MTVVIFPWQLTAASRVPHSRLFLSSSMVLNRGDDPGLTPKAKPFLKGRPGNRLFHALQPGTITTPMHP